MEPRHIVEAVLSLSPSLATAPAVRAQAGAEAFTATATVKTAGAATASVPVTIVVERKMSQAEADRLLTAFEKGGAAALHEALAGVAATGSVRLGDGAPTPTRIVLERPTDEGRRLTMVTDEPILFLGAGLPGARPKEGYAVRRHRHRTRREGPWFGDAGVRREGHRETGRLRGGRLCGGARQAGGCEDGEVSVLRHAVHPLAIPGGRPAPASAGIAGSRVNRAFSGRIAEGGW